MTEATQLEWLNAIPAATFIVQHDCIAFANRAASDLAGYPPHELTGMASARLFQQPDGIPHTHLLRRSGVPLAVELTQAEIKFDGRPAQLITVLEKNPTQIYRDAIAGSIDSFFLVHLERNAEGRVTAIVIVEASERAIRQTRIPQDQIIGLSLTELYPDVAYDDLVAGFARAVESGQTYSREMYVSNRVVIDGWYHVQLVPLENDHVAVFLRDIGERKASEEVINRLVSEVEQQARLLDEMLSATPDAFILFDHAGHYLYVNRKGLENSGLNSEQVIGKTWRELGFPEEAGLMFDQRLEQVFATGESITYEEQFPTAQGLRDFMTTLTAIHDPEGGVIFMLNTIHDITESKLAIAEQEKLAAELEQQARIFDEVLSTTPDSFLMIDREGRFAYSSPAALSNASLSAQQVIGKTWSELGFPEEMGRQSDQLVRQVFATGEAVTIEIPFPTAQGFRDFESIFSPLHDKDGQVVAVVITNRDITDRKQMEEALRQNQRLLTSINETALAGIAVVDSSGHYVQANSTYCSIFGYPTAELIGKHFTIILPPDVHEEAEAAHQRVLNNEGKRHVRYWRVKRKDGQEREVASYNNLLIHENGERFRVVVLLDVSEQREAQRALEISEQRLNSIFNSMEDAVWSVRAETRELLYCNPALETITGYSAAEFHANPSLLSDLVHPDDRDYFNAERQQTRKEQSIDLEYRIVRKDSAVRWVHNRFWIVKNATEPIRVDGIMSDITEQREAAEQTMQLTIERERVRILASFVRDASHEFRTPLSVINTRLYLMEKVSDPKRQNEYIDGIKEQADRILKLVESLIMMSRLDSMTRIIPERIDVNRVLTLANVSAQVNAKRAGVTLGLELAPEALMIQGNVNELLTALSSILDNAYNYTPRGGRIDIRSYRLNHREVVIEVRDTGMGINAEELAHIFERFYRVEHARSTQGFGLGLPIARRIVELHRGRIEAESVPDKGSTFRLIFPTDTHTP